jgi:hypothetical protein
MTVSLCTVCAQEVLQWTADGLAPLKLFWTGSLADYGASSFIISNAYSARGADSFACIQLLSLHEQCHQLREGGVYLLYLPAYAFLYR